MTCQLGHVPRTSPASLPVPQFPQQLTLIFSLADSEQSSSPRTGIGSDQEDSKPITLGK